MEMPTTLDRTTALPGEHRRIPTKAAEIEGRGIPVNWASQVRDVWGQSPLFFQPRVSGDRAFHGGLTIPFSDFLN
jgi:hypothetical protein